MNTTQRSSKLVLTKIHVRLLLASQLKGIRSGCLDYTSIDTTVTQAPPCDPITTMDMVADPTNNRPPLANDG
jgi:hypothetical protein